MEWECIGVQTPGKEQRKRADTKFPTGRKAYVVGKKQQLEYDARRYGLFHSLFGHHLSLLSLFDPSEV